VADANAPADPARRRLLRGDGAPAPLVHTASFVLRAFAARMPAVLAHVRARPHFEVVAAEGPRLVLLAEMPSERHLMEALAELEAIPGVLNAALVYHHAETAAQLEEAVPDAIDPS
jgi:periplasmic nitrate reductase NapD